jgi:hypothetical protein
MEKEKEALEAEIERLKEDLKAYLRIFPLLGVDDKEKERVVNQLLDDILLRKKKLK